MRANIKHLDRFRVRTGAMASTEGDGRNGAFFIPFSPQVTLRVIVSDGMGWEHVSACAIYTTARSRGEERPPRWVEMCFLKALFWGPEETVLQFHPPESEYINNHPACLHLWKQTGVEVPLPPSVMVGLKELNPG